MTVLEINEHALEMKREGGVFSPSYAELHSDLNNYAVRFVRGYFRGYPFKVDEDIIVSIALFEGVTTTLNNWTDVENFSFLGQYKRSLSRICNDYHKKFFRNGANTPKGEMLLNMISLDTKDSEGVSYVDNVVDLSNDKPSTGFMLSEVLNTYSKEFSHLKDIQTRVDVLKAFYSNSRMNRADALCKVLGTETYATNVRVKVTRINNDFIEFAKGYLSQQGIVEIDWEVM
jgi:hypothetical protein